MSDFSFKPYQDAYDNYRKDVEQLTAIGDRLMASAEGVKGKRTKDTEKLGKLRSITSQLGKIRQSFKDAKSV